MKYISINHFDDFVFHDAKFTFVSYQDNALVVSAKELNIRKGTEQNENKLDMELGHTIITFENFVVECYEYSKGYQIDEHGNWYIDEAQIIYQGKDAEKAFIDALKEEFSINGLTTRQKQERTIIELDTNYGVYFSAVCSCTNIQVEWDEYRGKA